MLGISVIIPVYNVEDYIEECLESVFKQSFSSYEIICINDASTDSSKSIIEKYTLIYDKIKLIDHKQNLGPSSARNAGIDKAKGKYIYFMDADDIIRPETLEELFICAEEYNLDEIFFNMDKIYGQEIIQNSDELVKYEGVYTGQEMFLHFMEDNSPRMEVWRQFYKREFLKKNKLYFYEGILHEDILFSFLCAMKSKRVMNVNKSYYIYRQRKGSIMSVINQKRIEGLYINMYEIFKYWDRNSFPTQMNEAIGKYFENIYSSFKYYLKSYKQNEELKNKSYAKRFLVDLMSRPLNRIATLSEEKIEKLKLEKNIILYGAGRVANEIIELLERNNIKIRFITVTNTQDAPTIFNGIKVLPIQSLNSYKNLSVVIICVTKKNVPAIKEKLNNIGFQKILEVNYC